MLSSHQRKIAMKQRRNAYAELAAVAFFGHRHRNGFAIRQHVGHNIAHHLLDAFERGFGCFCQPAQGSKLGAQAYMFVIFWRPSNAVGVVANVLSLFPNFSIA